MDFTKARDFIYRNARPLDLARWRFHFENGNEDEVLNALAVYQNEDGGFAHALEPDCWNPLSSPIQTWAATEILREIRFTDRDHPIVQGILRYLASGKDSNGHQWQNTVPTNNDYPHAPWWHWEPSQEITYNPTASLLGFLLVYADKGSSLYEQACSGVTEAYEYLQQHATLDAMHTVICYTQLYESLQQAGSGQLLDMAAFFQQLRSQIRHVLTDDVETWPNSYVCKPSHFIHDRSSAFYPDLHEMCKQECAYISRTQLADGTWNIPWDWAAFPEQWSISKNWWQADIMIKYIRFFNTFTGV